MRKSTAKKKTRKKSRMTKAMRRKRLEKATADYFASLSGEALREEQELERAITHSAYRVNFDE